MYVHGVPKQKEAADVHMHIEIHVILYNRFTNCKPATIDIHESCFDILP